MFRSIVSKKIIGVLGSVIILLTVLSFQNCGQVRLASKPYSVPSGNVESIDPKPTFLKPPAQDSTVFRAAFLIDMSFSMRGDACSDTLDILDIGANNNPANADRETQPCDQPTGVDILKKRISTVRKMIQDAQSSLSQRPNYNTTETFKVSIVPFSGPTAEAAITTGKLNESRILEFRSVDDALRLLDKLDIIQQCYNTSSCVVPARFSGWIWNTESSNDFIGTSVAAPAIEKLGSVLGAEVQKLKSVNGQDKRSQSRFELVYLSDGVPKPRVDHFVEVAKIVWDSRTRTAGCTSRCASKLKVILMDSSLYGLGQASKCYPSDMSYGDNDCFSALNSTTLYQEEHTTGQIEDEEFEGVSLGLVANQMSANWGEVKDNEQLNIFKKFKSVKQIFDVNPMVQHRQTFLRVDADPVRESVGFKTYINQLDPKFNWIEKSKTVFGSNYRHIVLNSTNLGIQLFPVLATMDSYVLKHIVAINLNTRININKNISPDTDADGLSDEDESRSGGLYDHLKARTNGYCLDSITFLMKGCYKTSCDPLVDEDGDGLSECDEKTLRTVPLDFDTDDDGIPDGSEVLMGFNPLVNDQLKDDNLDSLMNFFNFSIGLPPWSLPKQVAPEFKSNISVGFSGYKDIAGQDGSVVKMPGYTVTLKGMPLSRVGAVTSDVGLYKSKSKIEKWEYSLVGGNHPVLNNSILIIAKIENFQNPKDFYWIAKFINIPFGHPAQIDFDFESMDYHLVPDPQWSSGQ